MLLNPKSKKNCIKVHPCLCRKTLMLKYVSGKWNVLNKERGAAR